jgi:LPS sulfotransferase NodH
VNNDSIQIPWRARLSVTYIIASENRTGSYLLCDGLTSTKIAGSPTESLSAEYRHDLCRTFFGKDGKDVDFSASMKAMARHLMTPNGVFGAKVHWDQVVELWYESGYDGPPYVFLLDEFPGARYIHLSRRDTLAQAISLSIARQTNEWWRTTDTQTMHAKKCIEPVFNAAEILSIEADLIRQREAWRYFFRTEGITPLEMEYETLVADYRGQVARALDFLGLDSAAARDIPESRMQKQGTELNLRWHEWIRPTSVLAAG